MGTMLKVITGDALEKLRELPNESVQCCVTSPPYWGLRDYGTEGQLGLEKTPEEYVLKMVEVFSEVRRVLKSDGTCWLNLGDSYAQQRGGRSEGSHDGAVGRGDAPNNGSVSPPPGLKPKDLCGIPWMVAFALRADGWWLRQDIIWAKPNPMPESVTDRCTKAHEYLFLLTKSARYFYDADTIKETSNTNDIRRPYSSKGSWDLDGRPDEQRHGGEPRCFNGSKFNTGKTAEHQLHRSSLSPRVNGNLPGRDDNGAACNKPDQELRNKHSVWTVTTQPYPEAHFATYPPDLIKPCIMAGSRPGDVVLDPFAGSGTTGMVALELGRKAILIELNSVYVKLIEQRCNVTPGLALS